MTRIPNARDPRMSTDLILLFVFPKPPKKDFLSADESFSDDGSLATSGSMRSPPNATVGGSAPEENEEGDDRNDGDEEAASAPPPTRGREEEQVGLGQLMETSQVLQLRATDPHAPG